MDHEPGERRRHRQHWGVAGRRRSDQVELSSDHPGFSDPSYRARRNEIAKIGQDFDGGPVPTVAYCEEDLGVWHFIWQNLGPLLEKRACARVNENLSALPLDRTQLPQLVDLNAFLLPRSGFAMEPVAGLVAPRAFLRYLSQRIFLSTQYVRHSAQPAFTPEPDVIHEVIVHASHLADPSIAELYRTIGLASERATPTQCVALERIYWFAMEFGVIEEGGGLRAIGAALNSSVAELGTFDTQKTLIPWDIERIADTSYDVTFPQDRIFVAPSWERMDKDIRDYCQAI